MVRRSALNLGISIISPEWQKLYNRKIVYTGRLYQDDNLPSNGRGLGHVTLFRIFLTHHMV